MVFIILKTLELNKYYTNTYNNFSLLVINQYNMKKGNSMNIKINQKT